MTLRDRLTTERATGWWIALFVILIATAIAVGTFALARGFRTEADVERITRRVIHIEQPTPAEVRRSLDAAIGRLTAAQRRRLLRELIGAATPEQLQRLREVTARMRRASGHRGGGSRLTSSRSRGTTAPRRAPTPDAGRVTRPPRRPVAGPPTPTPAPTSTPAPPPDPHPSTIDVGLPGPLEVCTGLVDVNC